MSILDMLSYLKKRLEDIESMMRVYEKIIDERMLSPEELSAYRGYIGAYWEIVKAMDYIDEALNREIEERR